ncbi:MAG: hypothetical protein WDN26_12220 [Chitinophagaceae bacterium]
MCIIKLAAELLYTVFITLSSSRLLLIKPGVNFINTDASWEAGASCLLQGLKKIVATNVRRSG